MVIALLLSSLVAVPTGTATAASTNEQGVSGDMFRFTNDERSERGESALSWDPALASGAQGWADHLADTGDTIYHSEQNGQSGYGYDFVAENLQGGYVTGSDTSWMTAGRMHRNLMGSLNHRRNKLQPPFTTMGVGTACREGELVVVEWYGYNTSDGPYVEDYPEHQPVVHSDPDAGTSCFGDNPSPPPTPAPSPTTTPAPTPTPEPSPSGEVEKTRRAGSNRFATAAVNADPAAGTYVIASGQNWPDAVAAAPVTLDGGALLLVEHLRVPAETHDVLAAAQPSRLVLMGGTAAISPSVEAELAALVPAAQVVRVAGPERTTTAAAAAALVPHTGAVVVVDGGEVFSGMLAGSSQRGPVLLVGPSGLPTEAIDHLRDAGISRAYVYGTAKSNAALATQLLTEGVVQVNVPGDTEADPDVTSHQHARDVYGSASHAVIVSGASWPDSLTGAAYAAREGLPMLYAMPDGSTDWSVIDELGVTHALVIGGTAAIPDSALP